MELIDPSDFDVVVLGSGLPESLIASAAAKGGKKVLLIDPDDTYGGSWSTRNLSQFQNITNDNPTLDPAEPKLEVPAGCLGIASTCMSITMSSHYYDPSAPQLPHSREYLIDSCPKILFQGEQLVDLLVRSKVHNYMDFRALDASVIAHADTLHAVPATRSDIFKSKHLSISEKRNLMQFLNKCFTALDKNTDVEGFQADSSFVDALQQANLSPSLVDAISYGIALADQRAQSMSLSDGLKALQTYMESYNKFGSPAAFMIPLYGAGALVEGFIRSAAVHAAVTVLRHPVSWLMISGEENDNDQDRTCTGLHTQYGQDLSCEVLVANTNYIRAHLPSGSSRSTYVNRALLLSSGPLLAATDCVSAVLPPGSVGGNSATIRLLQVGAGLQVAPRHKFVLYCCALSEKDEDPVQQLRPSLEVLLDMQHLVQGGQESAGASAAGEQETSANTTEDTGQPASSSEGHPSPASSPADQSTSKSKPHVLHAIFFKQEVVSGVDSTACPSNVVCCPSGDVAMVGYDGMLAETERLFKQHFPDLAWWGDVELEPIQDVGLEEEEEDALADLMSAVGNLGSSGTGTP